MNHNQGSMQVLPGIRKLIGDIARPSLLPRVQTLDWETLNLALVTIYLTDIPQWVFGGGGGGGGVCGTFSIIICI